MTTVNDGPLFALAGRYSPSSGYRARACALWKRLGQRIFLARGEIHVSECTLRARRLVGAGLIERTADVCHIRGGNRVKSPNQCRRIYGLVDAGISG